MNRRFRTLLGVMGWLGFLDLITIVNTHFPL